MVWSTGSWSQTSSLSGPQTFLIVMSFGCRKRGARETSDAIDHSLHEQPSGISSSVVAGHDGSLVAPSMECFGIPTVDSDTDIVSDVSSSDFSDLACHNEVDVADNSVGEEQQLLQATAKERPLPTSVASASTSSGVKGLTDELVSRIVQKRIKDLKQPWEQGPISFQKRKQLIH